MTTAEPTSLETCLRHFQGEFNGNARVQKLIKGWQREILVETTDTSERFTMVIVDLTLREVVPGSTGSEPQVSLQATDETMQEIFYGRYNPAHALIDGTLAVFSDERDKVKLEAIAMVIWGM